jgi:hypothetical protein
LRLPTTQHRIFHTTWWTTNLLLAISVCSLAYAGAWEYSVRQYLKGFSDAIVPAAANPEQKVDAILAWMRGGPPRSLAADPGTLSQRDPETTLNYRQLLAVCGTATNAFLNLSRSAGLSTRRLLLLTPERRAKHVVAEVLIDGRWIIVDPAYRAVLRDSQGRLLTRSELRDPKVFAEAAQRIPNYPPEYNYQSVAHVRLGRLPMDQLHLRKALDALSPGWDEAMDWSLLLERESFFAVVIAVVFSMFFLTLRITLGWFADRHLKIPRFRIREHFLRAGAAFFNAPEIK